MAIFKVLRGYESGLRAFQEATSMISMPMCIVGLTHHLLWGLVRAEPQILTYLSIL